MKRNKENVFLAVFIIFQALLIGIMIWFAVTLTNRASASSRDVLSRHALKVSEENMKERVENIINLIEQERKNALEGVESIGSTIYYNMSHQDEEKLEEFLESWVPKIGQMQHGELIKLVLHDKQDNRYTIYDGEQVERVPRDVYAYKVKEYVKNAPYCKQVDYRYHTLYIISAQEKIDKKAQEHIYKTVYATQYGQNGYVWVNEVLDYKGGENYAICRIHPALKISEGQYISTNMRDAKGNYSNLYELEEIKKDGDAFYTFYYKNLKNDEVGEKATYAKLYEPFNWIIATATPLNDVMVYIETLNKENQETLSNILYYTIVILVLVFAGDVLLILYNNKKFKEKLYLEEKIASSEEELKMADYEAMTGVLRRGAGEYKIRDYLDTSENKNGVLIVVDLDDLKQINDTLGHRAGDEAIIGIADVLKSSFRQKDIVMRYGGDEFVVFIPEERHDSQPIIDRLSALVAKIAKVSVGENKEKTIHGSIGCATTIAGDTFETLFSRADKALYHVKRNGKNNFACYSPKMENEQ